MLMWRTLSNTGELTGESVIDTVYAIKIPKGTTVYTGPVGSQGGAYYGGYNIMQTFIIKFRGWMGYVSWGHQRTYTQRNSS